MRGMFEVPGDTRMVEESHNALRHMTTLGKNNVSTAAKRPASMKTCFRLAVVPVGFALFPQAAAKTAARRASST